MDSQHRLATKANYYNLFSLSSVFFLRLFAESPPQHTSSSVCVCVCVWWIMLLCHSRLRVHYWLTLVTGLVECLCFSGVVFGWASLVFVLMSEGYFSSLCVNDTEVNDMQKTILRYGTGRFIILLHQAVTQYSENKYRKNITFTFTFRAFKKHVHPKRVHLRSAILSAVPTSKDMHCVLGIGEGRRGGWKLIPPLRC